MPRKVLVRWRLRWCWLLAVLATGPLRAPGAEPDIPAPGEAPPFDVVIYGGTSAGVTAAVQTARMGKRALLIEPGDHLGGLTAGGLSYTDIGNKAAIGGLARQFYRELGAHYGRDEAWTFEPHVAEAQLDRWAAAAGITLVRGKRLRLQTGVAKHHRRIRAIELESGETVQGQMFIDATYEGDLMATAGVPFHVGREANTVYNETLNGVQLGSKTHQFQVPIDPFVVPGDPASGLLWGIQPGGPGRHGEGDARVQAYNFRMCLTDVAENRLPWTKPADYDPRRYELLLRYIQAGHFDVLGSNLLVFGRKTDTNNNGGFATDNIGQNYDYPQGDYATRQRIFAEHLAYQQGLFWFLAHDERLPLKVRDEVNAWGPCRDEFVSTGGWSHQMYIREARRMISDSVMTERHCVGQVLAADPVSLAAYGMDSHNVQRYAAGGRVYNEGDVQVHGFQPYPIGFLAIVPRATDCENLLVPVCLSASHIAYGSIRMEPVFMILGQSAATAACQAIDQQVAVQAIDRPTLRNRLLADGQILAWPPR